MKRSTGRILTTHAGSLPRPKDLQDLIRARLNGETYEQDALSRQVETAVNDSVRWQAEAGIDIISDGEQGKEGFLLYGNRRLDGFELVELQPGQTPRAPRRDQLAFAEFYEEYFKTEGDGGNRRQPVCSGPITYIGQDAVQRDIETFKGALQAVDTEEAFIPAIAPGTFGRGQNRYYSSEAEFLFAIAEAMKEEYRAIIDAGFILQIDDPGLPDTWDTLEPVPTVAEYQKYAAVRIEALNHALAGLPQDRVRYHICWGSWHGPHSTDIPLKDVLGLLLQVTAGAYSIEGANPRHEHEWRVWEETKFPEGKILIPGVIAHTTNTIEHPELVAARIVNFARLVGKENVIAGTDCGFSQRALNPRLHPSIVWAKLRALSDGAALATKQLW
ncbi:MAG: cobalamin-independent methionine synthase II family protein [Chloroflexi bacterium]|nr:cobalamin-independent methionine synthase II family protein [Chloroflexota bacterium]MCI0793068.1 cobalamin-independent methionine synthase II family protein [Chloroflexota bacterium]